MVKRHTLKLVLAAVFLAIALFLPFLTAQLKELGQMLTPMHFPVILCGFVCGPVYGFVIGIAAPLLRSCFFGMPVLYPNAFGMCFELATYGLLTGLLYKILPRKHWLVYPELIAAMVAGRLVWGFVYTILLTLGQVNFGWDVFIAAVFLQSVPGIVIQIIVIPLLVFVFEALVKSRKADI